VVKRDGGGYWSQRHAAYAVLRPHYDAVYREKLSGLNGGVNTSALLLLDRMIAVGKTTGQEQ